MAIIKPNNNTISAITALPAAITTGKILSVNITPNSTLSQASNNSSTYADISGVDLVITPVSASSKFVLFTNFHFDAGSSGNGIRSRFFSKALGL